MLAACVSSTGPSDSSGTAPIPRVPVEDLGTVSEPTADGQAIEPAEQRQHQAAARLLASARDAAKSNDHASAIVTLERAIRITPRNSELWTALAQAHAAKTDYKIATQHARKAIALAGSDIRLERNAWLALADIKEAQGESNEALAIRRRFARLSG